MSKQETSTTSINSIARKKGTGKVNPVYYNARAPHNQRFRPVAKAAKQK